MKVISGKDIVSEHQALEERKHSFEQAIREIVDPPRGELNLQDLAKDKRPSVQLLLEGYKSAITMLDEVERREYQLTPCLREIRDAVNA